MTQFGQSLGMSKKPTSYLDVMKQKEEVKPKFNLFDFSSVKTQQPIQTQQMNFGQPVSQRNVTNFQKPTIPQTQSTQNSGFSLFPTVNAEEKDLIQSFLDDNTVNIENRKTVFEMLKDNVPKNVIEDAIINKAGYTGTQPQDFSAEENLLQNLGERYKQFTTKEDEGFLRTLTKGAIPYDLQKTGALGKAFTDLLGYGLEKSLSPEMKEKIVNTIGEDNLKKLDQLGQIMKSQEEIIKKVPGGTEALDIAGNVLATSDLIGTGLTGKGLVTGGAKVLTKGGKQILNTTKKVLPNKPIVDKVYESYNKGVAPSVIIKQNPIKAQAHKENVITMGTDIVENKNKLKYTDTEGNITAEGKLPESIDETAQAITQRNDDIFNEYRNLEKSTGLDKQVSYKKVVDNLSKLRDDIKSNPELQDLLPFIDKKIETYSKATGNLDTTINAKKSLNQKLKAFYKKGSYDDVGKDAVDLVVNKTLGEILDETISNSNYSALKKKWGALKNLQEEIFKRNAVSSRAKEFSLFDLTNPISAMEVIQGIATGNVLNLVKASGIQGVKWYMKFRNSPNTQIKEFFKQIEKGIQKGDLKPNQIKDVNIPTSSSVSIPVSESKPIKPSILSDKEKALLKPQATETKKPTTKSQVNLRPTEKVEPKNILKPKIEIQLPNKSTIIKKESSKRMASDVAKEIGLPQDEIRLLKRVENAMVKLSNEEGRFIKPEDAAIYIDLGDINKGIKGTFEKWENIFNNLRNKEIKYIQKNNPEMGILSEPKPTILQPKKAIDNKAGFIAPGKIVSDIKKVVTPKVSDSRKIPKEVIDGFNDSNFLIKKEFLPKEIYRGVGSKGDGVGTARYGQGLYTTSNKSLAKQFAGEDGELLIMDRFKDIPKNPAWFANNMDFQNFIQYDVSKKMGLKGRDIEKMYNDLSELFTDLGFDGIVIGKGNDNEIVKFGNKIYEQANKPKVLKK